MARSILLIGEPGTGKTRSLETLPGGVVLFTFDPGGWTTLDSESDISNSGLRKRKLKFVRRGRDGRDCNPRSFKEWLESDDKLDKDEILVVSYVEPKKVFKSQYTNVGTALALQFIDDLNQFQEQEKKCFDKGVCHVALDSLTNMQRVILDFIVAMQGRNTELIDDWKFAINKIDDIVMFMVSIPFDFIMMSHTHFDKDMGTQTMIEELLVFGKDLPKKILSKIDDVFITKATGGSGGMEYYWSPFP